MRILLLRAGETGWQAFVGSGSEFTVWRSSSQEAAPLLAKIYRETKPQAVGVIIEEGCTWSRRRAAVTVANTLSFSWGARLFQLQPVVGEKPVAAWARAAVAAETAAVGHKLKPEYDGEPNITKPKSSSVEL